MNFSFSFSVQIFRSSTLSIPFYTSEHSNSRCQKISPSIKLSQMKIRRNCLPLKSQYSGIKSHTFILMELPRKRSHYSQFFHFTFKWKICKQKTDFIRKSVGKEEGLNCFSNDKSGSIRHCPGEVWVIEFLKTQAQELVFKYLPSVRTTTGRIQRISAKISMFLIYLSKFISLLSVFCIFGQHLLL